MTSFKRTSHLRRTPIRNGYAELYEPPLAPDFTQVEEFTVTQKYVNRPDMIAYDLYGESDFWWIIPLYNKNLIVDPINDLTLNKVILVPTRSFVAGI